MGEIISILRRSLAIQDFSVLLSHDLRTPLSPIQVISLIKAAKKTIENQIGEIHQEIKDAEDMSILNLDTQGKEVLNEEGLPIRDIREEVHGDEREERRAVAVEEMGEEETGKIYSMEEIDRMMDEAMEEEKQELEAQKSSSIPKAEETMEKSRRENGPRKDEGKDISEDHVDRKGKGKSLAVDDEGDKEITAIAGEGLSVGTVNGEELIAKLVDDSKQRYNPLDGTWIDDEEEDVPSDEEFEVSDDDENEEEEDEEEEDQYGRTRGYLVPPHIFQKSIPAPSKGVKFSSFEQPATPSFPVPSTLPSTNPPSTSTGLDIKNKPLPLKPALKQSTASPALRHSTLTFIPPGPNPSFATFSTTGTFSNPSSPDPSFSPMSSPNPSASAPLIRTEMNSREVMSASIVERQTKQDVRIPLVPKNSKINKLCHAFYHIPIPSFNSFCFLYVFYFPSGDRPLFCDRGVLLRMSGTAADGRIPSRKIPRLVER